MEEPNTGEKDRYKTGKDPYRTVKDQYWTGKDWYLTSTKYQTYTCLFTCPVWGITGMSETPDRYGSKTTGTVSTQKPPQLSQY